jgi:hypothetical protein
MDFHPRWTGGSPGISLDPHVGSTFKASQPTNPESRVSPEYGFARSRHIGSTRTSMVGNPPRKRFAMGGGQKARARFGEQIAQGTTAAPPDDFMAGGPVHARYGCQGESCRMITEASTAKPSGKFTKRYRGKMMPVSARRMHSVSTRARHEFGPGEGRGGLDAVVAAAQNAKADQIRAREAIRDIVHAARRDNRRLTPAELREIWRRLHAIGFGRGR